MPYQAYNSKINAWVKYNFIKGKGFQAINVKEREPTKKFKGVPVKGKTR